jgi:hypothetical protein
MITDSVNVVRDVQVFRLGERQHEGVIDNIRQERGIAYVGPLLEKGRGRSRISTAM